MEKRMFRKGMKLVSLLSAVAIMAGCMAGCGKDAGTTDDQGRTIISVGGYRQKKVKRKKTLRQERQDSKRQTKILSFRVTHGHSTSNLSIQKLLADSFRHSTVHTLPKYHR